MADSRYSSSCSQQWAIPTVSVTVVPGLSLSSDSKSSSGEQVAAANPQYVVAKTKHEAKSTMQPPRSVASTSQPSNGIVTRSKHTRKDKSSTMNQGQPSTHENIDNKSDKEAIQLPEPAQHNAVCSTSGKCQAGGELRLSHLFPVSSTVDVPPMFSLVGLKSPLLPGMTLVAAVDKRYLPDEETCITMLGFSGNCVGCGAKGFRYFTEFSQHINLRLATQPKKQKHIKYYIIKDQSGRLRKGGVIPWKVEGRKRSMPMSGPSLATPDEDSSTAAASPSAVSSQSSAGNIGASQTYNTAKRNRWESSSENDAASIYSGDEEASPAHSPASEMNKADLPNKAWLTAACGVCPVLLLCQHSIPNVPCCVDDIIVSDLLVGCFDPPLVADRNQFGNYSNQYHAQVPSPSMADPVTQTRTHPASPLTTQMAIILLIQHLSQLNEDDRLSREDIESLLQDAQLELSAGFQQPHAIAQSNLLTHVQLPVLANLAAATSKGRVKIVVSPVSLENAIVRVLKFIMEIIRHNQNKFPKVPVPDFIFILATSQQKAPEFCVLVTGISQARYLTEAMLGHPVGARITDNLTKLEQLFRLSSDALEQLVSNYEEVMNQAQLVYIPFNGYARMKIHASEALTLEPKITQSSTHRLSKPFTVHAVQSTMAKQLVSQVCSIADNSNVLAISEFVNVDFTIMVPPITTLYNQTVQRVAHSGILAELELEPGDAASKFETAQNFVIKHDDCEETQEKLTSLLKKVHTQPSTLFVMVFDQSQFYCNPRGVLDLPYYKEFQESCNVIMLFVTSAPYLFQSNRSFIDPGNEVYWSDSKLDLDACSITSGSLEDEQYTDDQDIMYFGLKEYCDSIKWTHQFPLVRQDDAFERMALRTTRATDDVNVSVLRCYLLIRHYCAAIMWAAGIKPAEPHCTLKTIQIIREIIETPVRNTDGSGTMLLIRIPSVELAGLAYDSVRNVRDRLGFQYRFCVIHDNGAGELEIEEYFLKRLRLWRKQRGILDGEALETWYPRCYEELLDLPCIVLLSGRERPGETFPRSLKYIDIRLIDRGFLYRSSLELEFSAIACYISTGAGPRTMENIDQSDDSKDDAASNSSATGKTSHYSSNYPLPVVLVSRSAFKAFQTDFYGYPKHLLLPTSPQTRWLGHGRPHLVTSNPAHQSLYYRQWTEPKPKQSVGCSSVNSRPVISMRSGSGIVISPDIPDVVEEDGMSAVETMGDTRQSNCGSECGETSGEDKPNSPVQNTSVRDEIPAKRIRLTNDPRPGQIMAPPSNPSESDNDVGVGDITDEESDTEKGQRFHPRSILFSGAPQVGKTGAYLHFMRLLYHMLTKLRRVDVYDELPWTTDTNKPADGTQKDVPSPIPPDNRTFSQLPFTWNLQQHPFNGISPLYMKADKGVAGASTLVKGPSRDAPRARPITSFTVPQYAAHDVCHQCDACKACRDALGPAQGLTYRLSSGHILQFLVPSIHSSSFDIKGKHLLSLKLRLFELSGGAGVKKEGGESPMKTPLMMPSTGRHENGLLNLQHTMEDKDHIHIVFVHQHEMALYHKSWPNHVIVGLPLECEYEGVGSARFFIKEFATDNFFAERKRQGVDGSTGCDVWPFILMIDDSCVTWQDLLKSHPQQNHTEEQATNTSLLKIITQVEAMPNVATTVGAITFRPFSSKTPTPLAAPSVDHTPPTGPAVLINILTTANTQFDRRKYSNENVDWGIRLQLEGITTLRLNHISVARKRIENGGRPSFKLVLKSLEEGNGAARVRPCRITNYSRFVTAPDTEDTQFLSVPAQFLLELYLAQAAATKLFQSAADKPDNPVLILDAYVNLGPRISVECLSSRKLQQEGKERVRAKRGSVKYGGLLLYFSDAETVTRELLQQFDFCEDAQLCLVCQDRNTLRQELVRLDLEENWRFKLRDELQTANDPREPSLFLLTGKHD